jgi:delta8-fatty-acid desaturase
MGKPGSPKSGSAPSAKPAAAKSDAPVLQKDKHELPELPESLQGKSAKKMDCHEQECIITVEGRTYNLTKWADHHPGGALIRNYNGRDGTHVFRAMHGEAAFERLKKFESVPAQPVKSDARSKKILEDFEAFRKELVAEGYFKTDPVWTTYKMVTTWLFLPIAIYFQTIGWYFVSALFTALFWQQLGWLGHDCAHHQVFENRTLNDIFGWFNGNVLQGYSVGWWKDRHNSHHAVCNILDADPDIDNIPMLAWASSDLEKAPEWCLKTIPYQHKYFLALLPALRLAWLSGSVQFVRDMKNSQYLKYRKDYNLEVVGLALHYAYTAALVWYLPSWGWVFLYLAISELLAGFGTAIVVFFNHYSCEKYDPVLADNFVCLQLFTTRNMTPGIVTDWICGGLNYQVEHHLFPTMPRNNLNKASKRVKQFCKDHDLPYLCSDFFDGLDCVLDYLKTVGQLCKTRYPDGVRHKKSA